MEYPIVHNKKNNQGDTLASHPHHCIWLLTESPSGQLTLHLSHVKSSHCNWENAFVYSAF